MSQDLRRQIDGFIESGQYPEAVQGLAELWRQDPGSTTAGYLTTRAEKLRGKVPLTAAKIAILRSFTVEPMVPLLRAAAYAGGIDLTVQLGDFNAYTQEILSAGSGPLQSQPDIVILAVQTRDIAPELWPDTGSFEPGTGPAIADRVIETFRGLVASFRQNSQASLILHNLEQPDIPGPGVLDTQRDDGETAAIARINSALREIAAGHRGVYVLDYDGLVARYGRKNWRDEKKWLTVRLPIRANCLGALPAEWLRYIFPLAGKIAKVLAVDLDNTLWGGVIGEDGMAGIKLSGEHPGASFQAVQRAMLDLHRRGILLAVVSKNNHDDALEAIEQHSGMLVRTEHFAAFRINWEDKAQNLRDLAAELNLGLDSIAFLDDNPVERQRVREAAPEVMVIEPGEDPADFARAIREFPAFERLNLSEEDRKRGEFYAADRQRAELETVSTSKEDFYRSLRQKAELAPVNASSLARVAQLTQKTNQFNLTTRRYTEQEIAALGARTGWQALSIRVRDRYCDNGLVGVAITHDRDSVCEIDTFLLSCRVIGRTVETALLAYLADQARVRGCVRLEGWFLPTKKNAPAREFYSSHGFTVTEEKDGATLWSFDLSIDTVKARLETPPWIEIQAPHFVVEGAPV